MSKVSNCNKSVKISEHIFKVILILDASKLFDKKKIYTKKLLIHIKGRPVKLYRNV